MTTITELIAAGKQHFDHKQYDQAQACLKQVADQCPGYADVHNLLGVIAHVEGRFQHSLDHFRKALEVNPHYTEALLNLAVLLNDLGQYDEAKKLYSKLRQHNSGKQQSIEPVLSGKLSNLHADIGDIYRSINLFDLAIEEYQKALRLNPNYKDIRTKMAQAMRDHGDLAGSARELTRVIKEHPQYASAHTQLGVTHYANGDIAAAQKAWKASLAINPEDQLAKMYLRLLGITETAEKVEKRAAKKSMKKK